MDSADILIISRLATKTLAEEKENENQIIDGKKNR